MTGAVAATSMRANLISLFLALSFCLAVFPWASAFVNTHQDEHLYHDSALMMLERGEWFVPRSPDGSLRLVKPVLAYWFSAAGMTLAGENALGARLFWILAAAATSLLTYGLARATGLPSRMALFAQAIAITNAILLNAAFAATPDTLLALFMTVAALGFFAAVHGARIEDRNWWAWCFWLGTALAVLSKGLLPVLFAAFGLLFAVIRCRQALWSLLRPVPVLIAIFLVAGPYGFLLYSYPNVFMETFFGDQFVHKVASSAWRPPAQFLGHILLFILAAFPWSIAALTASWRSFRSGNGGRFDDVQIAISIWLVLISTLFAFAIWTSHLYFLSTVPLVSVLIANRLRDLSHIGRISRVIFVSWSLVLLAFSVVFVLVVAAQVRPHWETALLMCLVVAAIVLSLRSAWVKRPHHSVMIATLSSIFVSGAVLGDVIPPTLGEELGRRLQAENLSQGQVVFVGHRRIAAQIRLKLGHGSGMTAVRQLDADKICAFDIIATASNDLNEQIERCGHRLEAVPAGWRQLDVVQFLRAAFTGHLQAAFEANRTIGYIAIRN